jgi:hypothetical protein
MGGLWSRLALDKSARPYLKNKLKEKRAKGMAQVIECLPTNLKILSSNPSTDKKKYTC